MARNDRNNQGRYRDDRYYDERERYQRQGQSRGRRRYEDEYDDYEDDYYEDVDKKARKGCLIAFLALLGVILVALLVVFFILKAEMDGKNATITEPVLMEITSSSGRTVGEQLEEAGVIGNSTVFRYYTRFKGLGEDFKSGWHTFTPGMSYEDIITELETSPPARQTTTVRVVEGASIMSVAITFEQNGFGTAPEFLAQANNLEAYSDLKFVQALLETPADAAVLNAGEGLLYPDTYEFYADASVEEVVRILYEKMDSVISDINVDGKDAYTLMAEKNLSMRDFLTIASIIQAESGYADYVNKVSAVIWNRLGEGWSDGTMGMDTTHEYLMKWMQLNLPEYADVSRSNITAQNIIDAFNTAHAEGKVNVDGAAMYYAYNTRVDLAQAIGQPTRAGLPVGPVCSITSFSLEAALNPDAEYLGEYYYFNNDKYGEHYFARTLAEHNQNVATANKRNEQYDREQAAAAEGGVATVNFGQALPATDRLYLPLPRRAA